MRRKIITPTFHFKILNEFFEVFVRNADILCHQLRLKSGKGSLNICKFIKLMALDNICGEFKIYKKLFDWNTFLVYFDNNKNINYRNSYGCRY